MQPTAWYWIYDTFNGFVKIVNDFFYNLVLSVVSCLKIISQAKRERERFKLLELCSVCHVAASGFSFAIYTMHNKFSNFLCFASLCAHLCAMSNNFKCNDENRVLGK